jgi:7,8-dihydro-6-hydroxymethylpterin-pyrophosphokinase
MEEIVRVSDRVFLNKKLKDSLLFLLESHTHLKNSEFSQAYIFCWLIVEQYISKEFKSLLSEKKEIEEKLGKNKDPDKKRNRFKLDILHSEEKLNDQEYSFLIEYNQKRNDFVHSGKTITESDAEHIFKFAIKIIQTAIRTEVA